MNPVCTSRMTRAGLAVLATLLMSGAAENVGAERPRVFALEGARIVTSPGQVIGKGTILLRDGLIEAVGENLSTPADAFIIDASGKTITAGFIDACTDLGQKKSEGAGGPPPGGGFAAPGAPRETPPGPVHPLPRVRPERRAIDTLTIDASSFEKHRAMGFTTAVTMPGDGIFKGEAAVINLGSGSASANIVLPAAGQVIGFEYGGFGQGYPSSLMGSIAAIRQTLLDAGRSAVWSSRYQADPSGFERPDYVSAYAALAPVVAGREAAIFDIRDSGNVTRAISLAREFSLKTILIATGAESAELGAIDAIKRSGYAVVLPLAFPEKPKVENADEALNVTLDELTRWDAAPGNPAKLTGEGIPYSLGTCRLTSPGEFTGNLRKALDRGLTAQTALAALTTVPARTFGVDATMGTLAAGKIANLVVYDGAPLDGKEIFDEKARPVHVFVDGWKFDIEQKKSKGDPNAKVDPRGVWSVNFTIGGRAVNRAWTIKGTAGSYTGTAETQAGLVEFSSVKLVGNEMTVVMPAQGGRPSQEIVVVITGETLEGSGEFGGGMSYTVKGSRTSGPEEGGSL